MYRSCPVLLGTLVLVASALGGCVSEDSIEYQVYRSADATRGGALWDRWWRVPGVKDGREPGKGGTTERPALAADNPYYVVFAGNARRGSQTWRCKECHGWDYKGREGAYGSGSHRTGFPGVLYAGSKSATALHQFIRDGGGLGEGHAFGKVLSEKDIADLVKFIREGLVDDTRWLDSATNRSTGDAAEGKIRFEADCAGCHGADGKQLNFAAGEYDSEYVADIASANPWEFIHKVRFGQPGTSMPTAIARAYYMSDVANLLAYAQSLSPPGLEGASVARGGALYDNWWVTSGASAPAGTNPLYQDTIYNTLANPRSGKNTWRCKECHGWDYRGRDGAYASGSHATGIAGVLRETPRAAVVLIAAIRDGALPGPGVTHPGHRFGRPGMLSESDVKDLALFIREGLVDDSKYLSAATNRSTGSASEGTILYAASCAGCHGSDGRRVNFAHGDAAPVVEYLGGLARENPWELLHKIRFGQPGSDEESEELFERFGLRFGHMPNRLDLGLSENQVAAIAAHAQTLPGSAERGGLLWDRWWKAPYATVTREPVEDNPYYVAHTNNLRRGSQTWRCKECHGWDLKGATGAYGSGSHRTGFPGVLATRDKGAAVFFETIAHGRFTDSGGNVTSTESNHAFEAKVGETGVRDLVNFIMSAYDDGVELVGTITNTKAVKVTFDAVRMTRRTRNASLTLGRIKYESNCAICHGTDGRALNFGEGSGTQEYLGTLARDNPWETLHKMRAGQPGSSPTMPSAISKGYSVDDLADLLWYLQELP